jgi:flagellar biosynthesis anti-sigma factor FlgM
MRIDFNQGTQPATEATQASPQGPTTRNAAAARQNLSAGDDQAQISGVHMQVEALATQASQMPEVRQEKVQALRQALASGRYHPSPERVAAAMVSEMAIGPAA